MLFAVGLALAMPAVAQAPAPASRDAATIQAGRYTLDKDHARVIWSVDHLGFSTYYGGFHKFDAAITLDPKAPAKSSVEVTIDTTTISTDHDVLESHLKGADWFDTAKFPTATFKSTAVTPGADGTANVTGNLTLHGVTRPVTLAVKLHGHGIHPLVKKPVVGFDATTSFKRSDFGIKAYVPLVSDEVSLKFSGEFLKE
jgi:polyisoprenoid-binding protein YceI